LVLAPDVPLLPPVIDHGGKCAVVRIRAS
jgi:hypothetical protein